MVGFGMTVIDVSDDDARKDAHTYLFKLVFVGDAFSGKSATVRKFTQDKYVPYYRSTIGKGEITNKMVEMAGELVKLEIWDTPAHERFQVLYFQDSQGICVLYDRTNKASFDNVEQWVHKIQQYAPKDVSIVVVGTRADRVERWKVTNEDIKGLVKKLDLEHFEISCLTGVGIHGMIERMVEKMIEAKKPVKKSSKKSDQTDKEKSKMCIIL